MTYIHDDTPYKMFTISKIPFIVLLVSHVYLYNCMTAYMTERQMSSERAQADIHVQNVIPYEYPDVSAYVPAVLAHLFASVLWYVNGRSKVSLAITLFVSVMLSLYFSLLQVLMYRPSSMPPEHCWLYPGSIWYSVSNACGESVVSMPVAQSVLAFFWMENSLNTFGCLRALCRLIFLMFVIAAIFLSVQSTLGGILQSFVTALVLTTHPAIHAAAKKVLLRQKEIYDRLSTLEMVKSSI